MKTGRQREAARDEIEEEIENVRIGWMWAIEQKNEEEIGKFLESLYSYYIGGSLFQEGKEAFEAIKKALGI